jgi:peptidoglycan/LPS O-acetylase OafA/YrhL
VTASVTRNLALDAVRGTSALAVCAGHLRNAVLADYRGVSHPGLFDSAFCAVTGMGHQAVAVFFVLSGYFVGGSTLRRQRRQFEWVPYFVARIARLWIVLLPCLLLTAVADAWTDRLDTMILAAAWEAQWHSGPTAGSYSASLGTFL